MLAETVVGQAEQHCTLFVLHGAADYQSDKSLCKPGDRQPLMLKVIQNSKSTAFRQTECGSGIVAGWTNQVTYRAFENKVKCQVWTGLGVLPKKYIRKPNLVYFKFYSNECKRINYENLAEKNSTSHFPFGFHP